MYAFLRGKVEYVSENIIGLDCNGVGFEIYATNAALVKYGIGGTLATVYTYLQFKEEGITLFGFYSKEEKAMFLKLISVSGVGAKTAISILSSMRLDTLALAIVRGDVSALSASKGIGKKTAERIILELKEKINHGMIDSKNIAEPTTYSVAENDAVEALIALGISKSESVQAVSYALDGGATTLESIVAAALKSMDRGV